MVHSFKPNPFSAQQTVVDKVTGEKSTRLVNTTKQADGHPISIRWKDPVRPLLLLHLTVSNPLVDTDFTRPREGGSAAPSEE